MSKIRILREFQLSWSIYQGWRTGAYSGGCGGLYVKLSPRWKILRFISQQWYYSKASNLKVQFFEHNQEIVQLRIPLSSCVVQGSFISETMHRFVTKYLHSAYPSYKRTLQIIKFQINLTMYSQTNYLNRNNLNY